MKKKFRNIVRDMVIAHNPFYKRKEGPRVICFHDIQKEDMFLERMTWLKKHFQIIPIGDIPNGASNAVAISFDDGYLSWYTNVFPVLKNLNIPATFFVNSGLLFLDEKQGKQFLSDNVRRKENYLKSITADHLKEMSKDDLITIGGHTKDHMDFSKEYTLEDAKEQIVLDKKVIENTIDEEIEYFAYPFGQLNNAPKDVQELVAGAKYKNAFTIIPGTKNRNPYLQNRDSLEFWQSTKVWNNWLHGAYDNLVQVKLRLQGIT